MLPFALLSGCDDNVSSRVEQVANINGLVAFWDFQNSDDQAWQSYYDKAIIDRSFSMYLRQIGDPMRYNSGQWPYNNDKAQLRIDKGGPFGYAVRFNQGYIYGEVPRGEFDHTLLDLNGRKPFTMIAWAKFSGNRHMIAGIWDEGGWNKYSGRRQAALFAGLFNQKGVIGHISSTGAASFPQSAVDGAQYARLRAIDGQAFENDEWVAVAMSYDPKNNKVNAYLNGKITTLSLQDPVTQDVMQLPSALPANPFEHKHPLYSPTAFQVKYNGYDFHNEDIKEHRIWVDLDRAEISYAIEGNDQGQSFRINFDILREGKSILNFPVRENITPGDNIIIPLTTPTKPGDIIITALETAEGNKWTKVGTPIERHIMEGAPFTLGRALGLDEGSIDHGSVELYLDGVAVFNRVLTEQELADLSFIK